jgi:hypothetical protein
MGLSPLQCMHMDVHRHSACSDLFTSINAEGRVGILGLADDKLIVDVVTPFTNLLTRRQQVRAGLFHFSHFVRHDADVINNGQRRTQGTHTTKTQLWKQGGLYPAAQFSILAYLGMV